MKTKLIALLLFAAAFAAKAETLIIAWTFTGTAPTYWELSNTPKGATAPVVIGKIAGDQTQVAITVDNNTWYSLSLVGKTQFGTQVFSSVPSNTLQFMFVLPPVPVLAVK